MTIKSKNPNDRRFATRRHCDPMKIALGRAALNAK